MARDDSVRKVADELEIRNILARLAILVDGSDDLMEYSSYFAEDVHWEVRPEPGKPSQFPVVKGRTNMIPAAMQRRKAGLSGPGTHAYHNLVTSSVDVQGDRASATSYLLFLKNADSKPVIDTFRIYKDQFVHTPQGWKLSVRHIEPA
jgi:hypothetical protein